MRLTILILTIPALLSASDWPRFRGPNGVGVSPDRGLPAELSRDHNVLWKTKTPKGHSSPIVVGTRVLITGYEGDARVLLCYDARTGGYKYQPYSAGPGFARTARDDSGT